MLCTQIILYHYLYERSTSLFDILEVFWKRKFHRLGKLQVIPVRERDLREN